MLKRALVAAVPCLLLLSGCGVAGTEFNPGVAARVGDMTVSTEEVDGLTDRYCDAVKSQLAKPVPLSGYRSGIAALLTWREATDLLNEDYGVSLTDDYYQSYVGPTTDQATELGLTGDEADAFVEVQVAQFYVVDLLTQIGAIELEREGELEPTLDFQQSRGLDELAALIEREGGSFDPRYGLEWDEGEPSFVDTDVSVAAGDLAKAAADYDPQGTDPTYVDSLPANATCG